MRNLTKLGLAAAILSAGAIPVSAHHSYAMFDRTKDMVVTGTVRTVQWTNPHVYLWMFIPNAKGEQEVWGVEFGGGPNSLVRNGWNKNTIKKGDKVKVKLHPLKDGTPGGMFINATLADGKVMNSGGAVGGN